MVLMEQENKSPDKLTTQPPNVTVDDFEDYLVTDDLMVDYFNLFLSLFSFPKPIWFNKKTETFEIVDNAKKNLLKQIKSLEHAYTPVDPIYNVTVKSKGKYHPFEQKITALDLKFETHFTVNYLDREQGVTWIKSERLPAFLQSDCYFEYRLAKLLSQLECNSGPGMPQIDDTYHPWVTEIEEKPMPKIEDKIEVAMKELYVCLGEASITQTKALFTEAKEEIPLIVIQSERKPTFTIMTSPQPSLDSVKSLESAISGTSLLNDIMSSVEAGMLPLRSQSLRRPSTRLYLENEHEICDTGHSKPKVVDNKLFEFVPEYPLQTPGTVFLEVKSEHETEEEKDEDQVSIDITTAHEEEVGIDNKTTTQSTETNLPATPNKTKPHLDSKPEMSTHIVPNSETAQLNRERTSAVSANIKIQGLSDDMVEERMESDSSNEEDEIRDFCYITPRQHYNFKNSKGIEKFKKFLQGTAGEKYWWLWMDIERLKIINDDKKKQSYLNKVRNRYLFSSGEYCMNAETRAKLGLSFNSQWTSENLCQIQSDIVAPLLLYWGPRYCMNQGFPIRQAGIGIKNWEDRQLRPKTDAGLFVKTAISLPFPAKIGCTPEEQLDNVQQKFPAKKHEPFTALNAAVTQSTQSLKKDYTENMLNIPISYEQYKDHLLASVGSIWSQDSRSVHAFEELELRGAKGVLNLEKLMQISKYQDALCDYKMDNLLQALQYESRTGYIFTHFCEETGNLLWSNGVNLWFELKEYQRLFFAEVFQPYKLRRQAQFIFATYIVEGAPADVEVDTESMKSIYRKLEPPFEELFDQVEEYVLILLLVPWMHMTEMDMSRFRKVELISETRYLDSIYYKKLQELQKKILPNEIIPLHVRSASLVQIPEDAKDSNYWQNVPVEFCNYTLKALMRNRFELENFQTFLQENFAGMDLKCWLDIEHFRKIPHHEKDNRDLKSKEIKNKYLNQKYFFGLSSPATKAQQHEVMMLAGGWGKLLHDQLSSDVLIEVQKYVKARMEKKWLPMFLTSPEFAERHHVRVQMQDVVEDQMLQKIKKKPNILKFLDNKWVSSSKEIIAFRKALLNPVTALQFQQYVSLKGELMENNVIFWFEVQKYKDMCHSQASKESIQNKITAIINCFINSSILPSVQIDIPSEIANDIINYGQEQGPYVFREAQMAVFDVLFKLWPDFSNFRRGVADESILPSLERKIMKREEKIKRNGIGGSAIQDAQDVKNNTKQRHYTGQKSSGSQLSLKGGSDQPADQYKIKTKMAGSTQQLSWSFSKYIDSLIWEKELIQRELKTGRMVSASVQITSSEQPIDDFTTSGSLNQSSIDSSE